MSVQMFDEGSLSQEKLIEFVKAYIDSIPKYVDVKRSVLIAEVELRQWYALAIANGMIAGKNDTEREGNARMMRPELYDNLEQAKLDELTEWGVREQFRIYDKAIGRLLVLTGYEASELESSVESYGNQPHI